MTASIGRPTKVWVIERTDHSRNQDNYPTEVQTTEFEEGFFLSQTSCNERAIELNGPAHQTFMDQEAARKRQHQAEVNAVNRHNKEAAILRAAGMKKADRRQPEPFVARTFHQFQGHTDHRTYEAVPIDPAPEVH